MTGAAGAGTAALAAAVLLVALFLFGYNRLVTLRNRAQAAWHDIDVYLRRRHNLVPNLVDTVKAYAAHERGIVEHVTALRTRAVEVEERGAPGEVATAEADLVQAVERLFAVAEAYPDLKADERFLALQDELAATENKIAFSRQLYNDTVTAYRSATESFPLMLVAKPFGFTAPALFSTAGDERSPVRVDLDRP
jgi:LemA protein